MTRSRVTFLLFLFLLNCANSQTQIVNYVSNGGFEELNQPYSNYKSAKYWSIIDSSKFGYYIFTTSPVYSIGIAPNCGSGFQYPRTGNNFLGTTFFCDSSTCNKYVCRGYPRNRLKQPLLSNHKYCVTYFVVLVNNSTYGISNFHAYFGASSIDTIKYCSQPLMYLSPQIRNPSGNIITDTLNWTPIRGTFTAAGGEKYILIGNFDDDSNTVRQLFNPTNLPSKGTDVYVDDVSVIDVDLEANAGLDRSIIPGDSAFIGRQPDVGIDEACRWYRLPNTSLPIDTVAGLWVKPVVTTTYVVRQEICGNVKWDTVVVYMNLSGIGELRESDVKIFPNPTREEVNLELRDTHRYVEIEMFDITGRTVIPGFRANGPAVRFSPAVPAGYYLLRIGYGQHSIVKPLVISN